MTYEGHHISGSGDGAWLKLIDRSFSMLRSSPDLPNLKMLYNSAADRFCEGFIWGSAWWIQNSYGFTLGAVPLLSPLWQSVLQRSYDAFWERMGDGKRIGAENGVLPADSYYAPLYALCAPDGALGDAVSDAGIAYRQGDGDFLSYDWFYEATAAGVNMQAEILLNDRRPETIRRYLPLMRRSLDHIESTRAENGLFLTGPASNLLAPSYGGSFDRTTGTVGKGYLTGLAVTTASALRKCADLAVLAGDRESESLYRARLDRTLAALPLLLTDEGYFVKSMDPDGTRHGIFGAAEHGYLEAVCNVDAVALGVADDRTARSIFRKIGSVPGIRPAGMICNNYPHLDDTYASYKTGNTGPDSDFFGSGNWVDGGCWATVEGRAILAYLRLGLFDDAFRAADRYMKWAEEYRQDAPLSQWGRNTNNPWAKENDDHSVCLRPVSVMIDNFAPVTCLLRGLLGYEAGADGLVIAPRFPRAISSYRQKEPVYFNGCALWLTFRNGTETPFVTVNGQPAGSVRDDGSVLLAASLFPRGGKTVLSVDCSGLKETLPAEENRFGLTGEVSGLPGDLLEIYGDAVRRIGSETDPLLLGWLREIALSAEAAALRRRLPFDRHELRPMTREKEETVISVYDETVRELYRGLEHRCPAPGFPK